MFRVLSKLYGRWEALRAAEAPGDVVVAIEKLPYPLIRLFAAEEARYRKPPGSQSTPDKP